MTPAELNHTLFANAPFKRILVLDFETAWCTKTGYTLSKMTTEEYVRDERFLAWGASVRWFGSSTPVQWITGRDLQAFFDSVDWSTTAICCHNAQFDGAILSWRYGGKPCFIFDTLSMARALRGNDAGNSLDKLAKAYGLPDKGHALHSTNGILAGPLPWHVEQQLAEYCNHDVFLCESLLGAFSTGLLPNEQYVGPFPVKELRLIDMTLKMYLYPKIECDKEMLIDAIEDERTMRVGLLNKLGVEESALASNLQFADLLRQLGADPPMKKSKATGNQTLALAKNDAHFQALLNGENENVRLLCEARLKVKSTSERTRAQRFLDISTRGALPVPLSYCGAGTTRWTAAKGSAINMQNLKRGSFLRKALMAPEGYQFVVGDLSQIEPRVLAWLADYHGMLDLFRSGADPYAQFGAQMFNVPGMTKVSHPGLRQSAKAALLGAGYMLGWAAFAAQLLVGFLGAPPVRYDKAFAKSLGVTSLDVEAFLANEEYVTKMRAIPHTCTDAELLIHCLAAKAVIDKYRRTVGPIKTLWKLFGDLIDHSLYQGNEFTHKCITFRKGEIVLPSGLRMLYPELEKGVDSKGRVQWTYGTVMRQKLHAGVITNNVTQGTARCVMTDGMLRVSKRYFVAGTVHDEQLAVVPDAEVEFAVPWVREQMTKEPAYLRGIPLAAEVGAHKRYGLAKE